MTSLRQNLSPFAILPCALLVWGALFVFSSVTAKADAASSCDAERRPSPGSLGQLRAQGRLKAALAAIDSDLAKNPNACREVGLRLERARVLDRIALHDQTRPAKSALEEINRARQVASAETLPAAVRGEIELARAYYHYRAEMPERKFREAEAAALRAIELARSSKALLLQSDAVHQLGLIRAQQRKAIAARKLFDESLELDRQKDDGSDFMLGEYHRHIALTYFLEEDWQSALPHYRTSHDARLRSGAVDGSLFSAISLGDALVNTGLPQQAMPYFEYARVTAHQIGSTYVSALSNLRIADLLERRGEGDAARHYYSVASQAATAIGCSSLVEIAEAGLDRIRETGQ